MIETTIKLLIIAYAGTVGIQLMYNAERRLPRHAVRLIDVLVVCSIGLISWRLFL